MKKSISTNGIAVILAALLTIVSCSKEGIQGPSGKDGNANIKVYFFNQEDSLTNGHAINLTLSSITNTYLDSSLVLLYYVDKNNDLWYPSPGLGANNSYQTKWYVYSNTSPIIQLRIANADGGVYSGVTQHISKVKVVVAKGSEFLSGKKEPVDYSNYETTMKYFGLSE